MLVHGLFWVALIWGLKDEEIDWQEAAIFFVVWAVLLAGSLFWAAGSSFCFVAIIVLDIVLLFRAGMAGALTSRF